MEFKRTLYHVREPNIRIGDDIFGQDDYFWSDEVDGDDDELKELVGRQFIAPVEVVVDEKDVPEEEPAAEEGDEESEGDEPEDELALLTRDSLLERLEEEGVTEDEIPGTGKNGNVTREDALATARSVLE